MAGPGTYGAYRQLRPIDADFVTPVEKAEDNMRADIEQQKAEAAARLKKKKELAQQFGQDYGTITEVVTNNKTIDEAFARGVSGARDELGQMYRDLRKNPSLEDDPDWIMKRQNLLQFSNNLATVGEKYKTYAATIAEGMSDGSLSDWNSGVLKQADSVFVQRNLDVRPDPVTGMPRAVTLQVDDDGQPVLDEDGDMVIQDLDPVAVLDGRGLPPAVQYYDFMEGVMEFGGKVGQRAVKLPNGKFSHYEYQKFEDVEDDVRNLIRGAIGSAARPSDVAKSIWADTMGREAKQLTEEDMKEIEDFYVEGVKTFYDEKNETTEDQSARERAKEKDREAAEEMETGLEMSTYDEGGAMKIGRSQIGEEFGGNAYVFTPKKAVEFINSKGQEVIATRVFLGEDDKVYYEGVIKGGTTTENTETMGEDSITESTTRKQIFDPTLGGEYTGDGDLFARALPGNVKNLDDLRRRLIDKKNSFILEQAKQDITDEEAAAKADELLEKYATGQ